MNAMADVWSNADLAGHIRPYADSATFMTGSGPLRGRDCRGSRSNAERYRSERGPCSIHGAKLSSRYAYPSRCHHAR